MDRWRRVLGAGESHAQAGGYYREHWALRDVSFELKPGEAVGVLGRNGAGKSTLLQIIAGTLAPTTGTVETNGRITALLELGSGFNPEFTGHENVFMNAAILGLTHEDTEKKYDEIAAFADIGDFIDQPVKTYSSGMMMRLAFAVQTALTPSVLIVDEALSVGDAKFQKKCFRKLKELREAGTTILFVSHDINAVTSFCDRAILLEASKVYSIGIPADVAKIYLDLLFSEPDVKKVSVEQKRINSEALPVAEVAQKHDETLSVAEVAQKHIEALPVSEVVRKHADLTAVDGKFNPHEHRFGNKKVEIVGVGIFDFTGRKTDVLTSGDRYRITQQVIANSTVNNLSSGFIIKNSRGIDLFGITNITANIQIPTITSGDVFEVSVEVDMWLAAGEYFLQAANAGEDGVQYDCRIDVLHFMVIGTPQLFTTSIVNLNPTLSFSIAKGEGKEYVRQG